MPDYARFGGKTFDSRHALAAHLAVVTGHSVAACDQALKRLNDDPDRVVAYYRKADVKRVYRYDGLTFRTQRELGMHIVPIVGRSLTQVLATLKDHSNDADAVVARWRQMDDFDQYGVLAQELRGACRDEGCATLDELTVLTRRSDPYRFDHPAGRAEGQWFTSLFNRLVSTTALHLRGFHYVLVSAGGIIKPDGTPYRNTDTDWVWLVQGASAAARWLGMVPFERILDERNDPPVLPDDEYDYLDDAGVLTQELQEGIGFDAPDIDDAMPTIRFSHRSHLQPYRIVLFGEKSSLAPVLSPVRETVNGELLLPTGESTTTMVFNLARRIAADGRPCVIFYFSDFDPAGWQMAISVARKLQALRSLRFPNLDVQLYPVALNFEQVSALDLPSTPLKPGEARADRWREVWNHEQTEIDALATLNPDALRRIAEDCVAPFFDPTLVERTERVVRRYRRLAERTLAAHPQYADAQRSIQASLDELSDAAEGVRSAQEQAMAALSDIELPEPPELPEPKLNGTAPEPLFNSGDGYVTATLRLKQHRALYPDADDDT